MRPYSVEVYTRDLALKDYNTVDFDSYQYKFDYLDPEQNKIRILKPIKIDIFDYVRLFGNGKDIYGYVSKIENGDDKSKDFVDVTFYDIENLMDIDIIVDTSLIGQGYLEDFIAQTINGTFVQNEDELQNIPGMTVDVPLAEVSSWSLDISADDGEMVKANLLDDIILPAFKAYSVRVMFGFDIKHGNIVATISINNKASKLIETSLPNIYSKTIKFRQAKKEVNKDIVANKKDYSVQRTYFLHTDGTHSTEDTDRISPVYSKVETVSTKTKEEYIEKHVSTLNKDISTIKKAQSDLDKGETLTEETIEKEIAAAEELNVTGLSIAIDETTGRASNFDEEEATTYVEEFSTTEDYEELCEAMALSDFTAKADEKAEKTFNSNKYENLIKIECDVDDAMVEPWKMEIGQKVSIYDDGNLYETILTGKEIKNTATLVFGNERIELTKILKGRA